MPVTLEEYRSGTGKVLRPGDLIRVDASKARYKILAIRQLDDGTIEVDTNGGRPGYIRSQTWPVDRVTKVRKGEDPNAPYRAMLHEISQRSLRHRPLNGGQ